MKLYRYLIAECLMVGCVLILSACTWQETNETSHQATIITADTQMPPTQTPTVLPPTGEPIATAAPVATQPVVPQGEIGGSLARAMDSLDKSKMITALDKATGKSTKWSNPISNTNYTVTPIKKVIVQGNTCREYAVTAEHNDKINKFIGTACLGDDGNWKSISSS